ncbi:hypothetical protein CsSME_00015889 [Camellia sinensis var. sinensis]
MKPFSLAFDLSSPSLLSLYFLLFSLSNLTIFQYPLILVSHTLLSERNFGVKSYWDTLCSMVKRSVSIPDRKLFNSNMSGFKDIGSRYWMPSPSTQGDWFVMGIG